MTQNIVHKVRITEEDARKADEMLSKRELVSLVCVISAKRNRQEVDQACLQPLLLHLLAFLVSSLFLPLSFPSLR